MQTVVETPEFLRRAKVLRIGENERAAMVDAIARQPDIGDEIPGSGGARKVRFAAEGRGMRGGYRIITFYTGTDIPVFLLSVFAKNEKSDLSPSERGDLRAMLKILPSAYRRTQ